MVAPGTVFASRWRVEAPLAEGSTSEVFRGLDLETGAAVALKVLRPEYAEEADVLQRFQREGRVAERLHHPRIVEVRAFGVDGAHPWIAMELLEGETLEARLARGRLTSVEALEVLAQVADAVDHAHGMGVVHRDLKPDNCFLVRGGEMSVKVLDFGFAKITEGLAVDELKTAHNAVLGTPLYMAPEQVRSSATVDRRADLWSLGVMAYELVAGAAPFSARAPADLFVEILSRPIPPPSSRDAALPRPLDRWALRALARDPDARFGTGHDLVRALRHAMDPAAAREAAAVTAPHRAVRPWRRALVAVAVALALALGAALAWYTARA